MLSSPAPRLCWYPAPIAYNLAMFFVLTFPAASASPLAQFQVSESAGVKLTSRNTPGPVATLALVSKAGTRYQWVPGLADGLEKFAFKVC